MIILEYSRTNGIKLLFLLILLLQLNKSIIGDELEKFTSCNNVINMEERLINQGELDLVIRDVESSGARVSCDFTVKAGTGRQVMFYFTDMYLGSPNKTERVDKSCIEPKDVTGPYEMVPQGIKPIICSRTHVDIGDRVYTTSGSALSLRFYRNRGYSITVYFKLVFTAFRSGSCRTTERKCSNERCISHDIVCNGFNPCGDNSDCPTGLEHLSSWAMSGIVVLALLSGGIIIIMATVCLQRASSKRYDFDDITVPANGSLCHEHHNVEMNEVSKETDRKTFDKSEHIKLNERQYKKCDVKDNKHLFNEYHHSLLEPPSGNDREQLIHSKRSSSENYSDEFGQPQQDADFSSYPGYEERKLLQDNGGETEQYGNKELVSFKTSGLLVPEEVAKTSSRCNITSQEGFHFSGNSLVYSDSDSGGEDERFKVTSLDRKRQPPLYLKSSSSHNGAIGGDSNMFGEFKPPPPPYSSTLKNKKIVVDKTPNHQANFV